MNSLYILSFLLAFMTLEKSEPCCEISVPNYVSLNRDGAYSFAIMTNCSFSYCDMKVYNRWGNEEFNDKIKGEHSLDSLNKKLEKLFIGKKIKDGVYFYILKLAQEKDTCEQKGNISVLK